MPFQDGSLSTKYLDLLLNCDGRLFQCRQTLPEGFKKLGLADKVRFYNIAQASLEECRYYLILARDLGYGDSSGLMDSLDEVGSMLEGYSRAIRLSY